jgi:hypothetical protein
MEPPQYASRRKAARTPGAKLPDRALCIRHADYICNKLVLWENLSEEEKNDGNVTSMSDIGINGH